MTIVRNIFIVSACAATMFRSGVSHAQDTPAIPDLDRENVARLLERSGYFPNDYLKDVPVGDGVNLTNLLPALRRQDPNFASEIEQTYSCLEDLGYLQMFRARGVSGSIGGVDIVLTNKAAEVGVLKSGAGIGWSGISSEVFFFKVATRTVRAVTGIRNIDPNTVRAQIVWERSNPNDISGCIYKVDSGADPTGSAYAILAKYDDGWRIESAGYGDGSDANAPQISRTSSATQILSPPGRESSTVSAPSPREEAVPIVESAANSVDAATFIGQWKGDVTQGASQYSVLLHITSLEVGVEIGQTEYSAPLNCKAVLTLESKDGDTFLVKETVRQSRVCASSYFRASPNGPNTVAVEWYYPRPGGAPVATAELQRVQ